MLQQVSSVAYTQQNAPTIANLHLSCWFLTCGGKDLSPHTFPFTDLSRSAVFGGVGERGDHVIEWTSVCITGLGWVVLRIVFASMLAWIIAVDMFSHRSASYDWWQTAERRLKATSSRASAKLLKLPLSFVLSIY
jgi:hypothetical protein